MRFNIRDMFWLTVVVALAVGWSLDSRRIAFSDKPRKNESQQIAELEAILQRHGYEKLQTPEGSLMVLKQLPAPAPPAIPRRYDFQPRRIGPPPSPFAKRDAQ